MRQLIVMGLTVLISAASASVASEVASDGSIRVKAFNLPESSLLDARTRAYLQASREGNPPQAESCPSLQSAKLGEIPAIRKCLRDAFRHSTEYSKLLQLYPVDIAAEQIGGVPVEIFSPKGGVPTAHRNQVLINLHGGGFLDGSGWINYLEAAPIAAVAKYKVVSVDYRLGPEYSFPAASDDVAATYRALLKDYKPQNIGIFGCSAGGLLTAQSVARIEKDGLPLPAAIGIFGSGAVYYQEGDSAQIMSSIEGWKLEPSDQHPYLKTARPDDPLAYPGRSSRLLQRFPPTLLITSTRDLALSAAVFTYTKLLENGVEADLRIWEGIGHCFAFGSGVPESDEAHTVIAQFFEKHLGRSR